MAKSFTAPIFHVFIIIFTVSFVFNASASANENALSNPKADEIYNLLETGYFISDENNRELLDKYKAILAADDVTRQKRYIRLNCWNLPEETTEDIQAAISYADKYLQIFMHSSTSPVQIDLQYCKTWYLHILGENEGVVAQIDTAIKHAYQIENPRLIADGRSIRGSILSYLGNFTDALEDLIVAQNMYESLNLPYQANNNLAELANSYRRFGDVKTALKYQITLEQVYLKNKNFYDANMITNDIALSLEKLEHYEEAILRFQKVRDFWLAKGEPLIAADATISIAANLISLGRLKEAAQLLLQAQQIVKPGNDDKYSYLNFFLAQLHYKQANYEQAIKNILIAEKSFELSDHIRGVLDALRLKSKIYEASGHWPLAYQALNAFITTHFSIDEKVSAERNAKMQTQFDTNKIKTENEVLIQRSKDKERQLDILQSNEKMQVIILILVFIILVIALIFAYKQLKSKQQFKYLACTDELTKLVNRREIYVQGNQFLNQAKESATPFSIISFDADHFKNVNDTFGHDMGDKVLTKIALISKSMMRDSDVVGRIGGEEFVVLLPNIDKTKAIEIANRLVENIAKYDWSTISPNLQQTVSAGVADYSDEEDLSPLLIKADKALYCAKSAGRNCVKVK